MNDRCLGHSITTISNNSSIQGSEFKQTKQTQFTIKNQNEKFLAVFPRNGVRSNSNYANGTREQHIRHGRHLSETEEKNPGWAQSKEPRGQEISPSSSPTSSFASSVTLQKTKTEIIHPKNLRHSTPPPVALSLSPSLSASWERTKHPCDPIQIRQIQEHACGCLKQNSKI